MHSLACVLSGLSCSPQEGGILLRLVEQGQRCLGREHVVVPVAKWQRPGISVQRQQEGLGYPCLSHGHDTGCAPFQGIIFALTLLHQPLVQGVGEGGSDVELLALQLLGLSGVRQVGLSRDVV